MDDRIIAALGMMTLAVLLAVLLMTYGSRAALDQTYKQTFGTPTVTMRNEWGHMPASKERMCAATIQQWSEWCK